MKKKLLILCMAGALTAVLAGCGSGAGEDSGGRTSGNTAAEQQAGQQTGEKEPADGKEQLVFVNYRDIRDLNPHLYAGEMYAQEMLYETLVNITETGYEGCLAESWEISEDGRVYTFKIRQGVVFPTGRSATPTPLKRTSTL